MHDGLSLGLKPMLKLLRPLILLPLVLAWALLPLFSVAVHGAETHEVRYANGLLKARWESRTNDTGEVLRHGIFVRYHLNGNPAMEGWYRDNEPVGTWNWWDEAQFLLRSVRYEFGIPTPIYGEELTFPQTILYRPNGEKMAEGHLKGKSPHGVWHYWHEPDVLKARGEYMTGIPHGQWIHYYRNGQVEREEHFVMGLLNGEFRESYPNGQERRHGWMDQGLKTGPCRYWYPDGRLQSAGAYQYDLQDGDWVYWNKDGVMTAHVRYEAGKSVERLPLPEIERFREPFAPILDDLRPPPQLFDQQGGLIDRME